MPARVWTRIVIVLAAVIVAAGLVALGRATVDTGAAHSRGYAAGRSQGYADGQSAGEADGIRVGRALQGAQSLPPDMQSAARDAFDAGYTAGANDVFNGYDGGWDTSAPYVVVLVRAGGGVTYRIGSRTQVRDGVDYDLCPDGRTLCQAPRR
jgi:hypothetical protein